MSVDYDSWKLASPYDDYEPEPEGWVREEDIPSQEDTRDFIKGVVEALYKTRDTGMLEHCLEELCHLYDVELENINLHGVKL